MRIRSATTEDLPRLIQLLGQDELGGHRDGAVDTVGDYEVAFNAIASDPNNDIVVGDVDGEVVCMLQLTFLPHLTFRGGWRAQIEGVRVASDRRGEGLGRQLISWAVGAAKKRGCHLVQLTTNKQRTRAISFYESLGFDATHEGMKLYVQGTSTGR